MIVSEIFLSIQGESTYAGLPCVFVRLSGCNLCCRWCDTTYARTEEGARDCTVEEVLREIRAFKCPLVEITGGEPLLQEETVPLSRRLVDEGFDVLIETNGSVDIGVLDPRVIKIVDVKCPSSGYVSSFLLDNLKYITSRDEIKFVIANEEDYEFSKRFVEELVEDRTERILFAPVRPDLDPKELAEWILRDGLRVRFQIQLHKYIWGEERGR